MALNDERLRKEWLCWKQLKTLEDPEAKEGLFHIPVDASKRDLSVRKEKGEHPRVKNLIVLSVD